MLVVSTLQRVNNSLKVMLYETRNKSSVSEYSLVKDVSIDKDNQTDIADIIPRYVSCVIDLVPVIGVGGSSNPDKIRYLAIIYCSLCDIAVSTVITNITVMMHL
ncbi:unnamed protein product [Arctia plantaginis]|uniref:Uncharacterized protein n=1 Tax=Arctia plantaginis TaxID=874455 RepID=A0A8S0ZCS9_ARCPL|nr:unnamed protein product [Arctia plantaginis]